MSAGSALRAEALALDPQEVAAIDPPITVGAVAARRLVGAWLVAAAIILALPGPDYPLRLGLVATHLVLAHLLFDRPFPGKAYLGPGATWGALADWAPLLIAPVFYWEAPLLAGVLHGPMVYDSVVQHWDLALFGVQPSQWLARRWPWLWLSEPLHAAYLSYYLFIVLPPVGLYFSGNREGFRRVAFTLALAFAVHATFSAIFPVLGPRYVFPAPDGPLDQGMFYRLTHRVLQAGSSPGTAFPSSHVGIATAVTVALAREAPRAARFAALVALALAFATVYGGFHYAVDAIDGAVLGIMLGTVAPVLREALSFRVGYRSPART